MKYQLILVLLISTLQGGAIPRKVNLALKELDKVMLDGPVYMGQKENRISRLKNLRHNETSANKVFELGYLIIDEYKSYNCDSALTYIDENLLLAEKENNPVWQIRTKLQYSFVLSSSGLFLESLENLRSIDTSLLTDDLRINYFQRWEQFFHNSITYVDNPRFASKYADHAGEMRYSLLVTLPANSNLHLYYQYREAFANGDYEKAKAYQQKYLDTLQPETHEHAKMAYDLAGFYERLGDEDAHIEYLIKAVRSDVIDAVKENRALLALSTWLYQKNDIKRAYRYIQYALNDANFYNARFRYFELSKVLPVITDAYQKYTEKQTRLLLFALTAMSLFFIILLGAIFFLQKQKKALDVARKGLDDTNKDLEKMNARLHELNQRLMESDRVKEEYIGHFIDLYSEYITKLEDYRKMINNKIAAKRFDELLKMTASSGSKTNNVKELNINFDRAFLRIYPGFVDAFNALLKPEERFELKKEELNTELRVFALMRLGITDSNKIASFLRCSVQTVYNYRSKVKRKAIHEQDDIETAIGQL